MTRPPLASACQVVEPLGRRETADQAEESSLGKARHLVRPGRTLGIHRREPEPGQPEWPSCELGSPVEALLGPQGPDDAPPVAEAEPEPLQGVSPGDRSVRAPL